MTAADISVGTLCTPRVFWNSLTVADPMGCDACWLWTRARCRKGYGSVWVGKVATSSHRLAWALTFGEIPKGMHVLHRCDTPACVRPSHLFLGTNQDNVDDKMAKGREAHVKGEASGSAVLTETLVAQIFAHREAGLRQIDIAARVGVCQSHVSSVLRGRSWAHVAGRSKELAGYARGERVAGAKLDAEKVRLIRRLHAEQSLGPRAIARLIGVSDAAVSRVLKGIAWRHVT